MKRSIGLAAALLVTALAIACDGEDGPTEPTLTRDEVAGTYLLTTLTFDPLGQAIDPVEIAGRFGDAIAPRLIVTPGDSVQFVFEAPGSGLITTASGSYVPTTTGIRITFRSNSAYASALLPRRLSLDFAEGPPGTLAFTGTLPDGGVDRDALIELVPELQGEQLLDPTPGDLTVLLTQQVVQP